MLRTDSALGGVTDTVGNTAKGVTDTAGGAVSGLGTLLLPLIKSRPADSQ